MCLDSRSVSDEADPSLLQMVTPRSRDVSYARQQALSKGYVMAMILNGGYLFKIIIKKIVYKKIKSDF